MKLSNVRSLSVAKFLIVASSIAKKEERAFLIYFPNEADAKMQQQFIDQFPVFLQPPQWSNRGFFQIK